MFSLIMNITKYTRACAYSAGNTIVTSQCTDGELSRRSTHCTVRVLWPVPQDLEHWSKERITNRVEMPTGYLRCHKFAKISASGCNIEGLVHMNLASKGFCISTDLSSPRTDNLFLCMNIPSAINLLGKFVKRWWRHKRSTVKQAKIFSQLLSCRLYFRTTKQHKFDILS